MTDRKVLNPYRTVERVGDYEVVRTDANTYRVLKPNGWLADGLYTTVTDAVIAIERLQAKTGPVEEYWFTSEAGIRRYHNELMAQEAEAHRQKMARIEQTQQDMIDALRKSKATTVEPLKPGQPYVN